MATKVLRLKIAGKIPVIVVAILALLSCDRRHVTNPINFPVQVGNILVSLSPPQVHLPSTEAIDSVQIMIAVLDSQGVGMPNINVHVTRTPAIGFVSQPDSTDSLGITSALYITDPGIFDSVWINAAAGNKSDSALLVISPSVNSPRKIVVSPHEANLISGEIDTFTLFVTVLDSLGLPVNESDTVYLENTGRATLSLNNVLTIGGRGQALITLTPPANMPGYIGPDTIFVRGSDNEQSLEPDTVIAHFIAGNSLHSIVVSLQKPNLVANGLDTTSINAIVTDPSGNPVPDGTTIYLNNTGVGLLSQTQLTTINGQARGKITAPINIIHRPNVDTVFVRNFPGDSANVADTAIVHYIPGPIHQMAFIYPETTVTLVAGSGDTCSVILSATDANGNPVSPGTQIVFGHTLPCSNLIPQPQDTVNGYFRNIYQVGDCTGDDNVTAWIV